MLPPCHSSLVEAPRDEARIPAEAHRRAENCWKMPASLDYIEVVKDAALPRRRLTRVDNGTDSTASATPRAMLRAPDFAVPWSSHKRGPIDEARPSLEPESPPKG
jgi:hypothetical protein